MRTLHLAFATCLALAGLASGCGDDSTMMMTDTGMGDSDMPDSSMPDSTRPDTPPPPEDVCTAPIDVVGEIGTVSVSGNTSTTMLRPRDLGADCGNAEAARFAPQEVVAYQVPGTEPVGVLFTLATSPLPLSWMLSLFAPPLSPSRSTMSPVLVISSVAELNASCGKAPWQPWPICLFGCNWMAATLRPRSRCTLAVC